MIGGYGRGWRHRRIYYATGIPGCGRGRGMAFRRGLARAAYCAYPAAPVHGIEAFGPCDDEAAYLEDLRKSVEEELEVIRDRLDELSRAKREK